MKLHRLVKRNVVNGDNRRSALRTLLSICSVVAVLCMGISALFYQVYKGTLVDEMIASSAQTLDRTDRMISEAFGQIENIAYQQTLATARLINKSSGELVYDYFSLYQLTSNLINMKNSHNYIHSVYIYFNQGNVIVTSFMGTTSFRLFYDTAWLDVYSKHAGEVVWINGRKPYDAQYEGAQDFLEKYHDDTSEVLTLLVPLSNSLRDKGGVIIINVYEREIAKLLSEASGATEMFMVDDAGRIIVSADNALLYTNLPAPLFSTLTGEERPGGNFNYRNEHGEEFICVYARSRFNDNYILELLPLSQVLKPTTSLLRSIILCALLFLAVSLILVMLLVNLSYRPIRQLYKELGKCVSVSDTDTDTATIQQTISKIIQDNKTLTKLWENNRMLIKHRTLSLLLQGKVNAFDADPKRLEFLEIRFPYRHFACCVLHLDTSRHSNVILDEQYEVVKMQLFSMVQQCLNPPVWGYTVDLDDLNVALILNVTDSSLGRLLNLCQQIQQVVADSEIVPYTLSIGIGNYVTKLDGIALSFQQACSAMRYAAGNCPGEVISFSSISVSQLPVEWGTSPEEEELLNAVRIGDLSTAARSLNGWFEKLQNSGFPLAAMKQIVVNQIGRIINLLPEMGITDSPSVDGLASQVLSLPALERVQALTGHFVEDICSQIQVRREHKNTETMEKIISYLRQNYAQDISLKQVAEDVFMSVPYLCKIFKEYTKKTFNDYLTTLRVEASMALLCGSNKKIKEIAGSVGYTNTQSYIRAFKKYNHMTPSEFRDSMISQKLRHPLAAERIETEN